MRREEEYDYQDDMTAVASHCKKFSRRNDVNVFNMANYMSCENCRHMASDSGCRAGEEDSLRFY